MRVLDEWDDPEGTGPRRRVLRSLIVEDDGVLRRAIVRTVQGLPSETMEAGDVRSALRLLQVEPDLVVLDVALPDGKGIEVARQAALLARRPLMIAMSGTASASEAFELANVGVHHYLSKPFRLDQFVSLLNDALGPPPEGARADEVALSPRMRRALERYVARHGLSPREREIVALALTGVARREFPARLGVTDNTCKTAIRRLLAKCSAERLVEIPRRVLVQSEPGAR